MDANRLEVSNTWADDDVIVDRLTVHYRDNRDTAALDGVSFSVPRGRVLAVVGANGAGKSTLFRALLGLVPVSAGTVRLFGKNASELEPFERGRLAYVSERHVELEHQRLSEVAAFRAAVYPRFDGAYFQALTDELALPRSSVIGQLSRGQRAAAVVGLALAQTPDLLLLDDPTLGLDPLARRRIIQAVLGATRARAITVVLATHELADVERVADDVTLLVRGAAPPAMELENFVRDACVVSVPLDADADGLRALDGVLHVWRRRADHEVVIRGDAAARRTTLAALPRPSVPRAVTFEELALAWLAHASEGRS